MKRVAIGYSRVSTEDQAREGVSLADQENKIRAYATLHDLAVLDALADEGISGKSIQARPGVRRAIERVVEHRGVLVVYSLSRLGRNTRELIEIADRLRNAGCDLVSISESIDTQSAMGRLFYTIIAAFAQLEREQTVERTQGAMDHLRRKGEFLGNAPYGFEPTPRERATNEDGSRVPQPLRPCEGERAGLALILTAMREPAVSYAGLAQSLNASGIKPRTGEKWDRGVVRAIVLYHRSAEGQLLRSQHGIEDPVPLPV